MVVKFWGSRDEGAENGEKKDLRRVKIVMSSLLIWEIKVDGGGVGVRVVSASGVTIRVPRRWGKRWS